MCLDRISEAKKQREREHMNSILQEKTEANPSQEKEGPWKDEDLQRMESDMGVVTQNDS